MKEDLSSLFKKGLIIVGFGVILTFILTLIWFKGQISYSFMALGILVMGLYLFLPAVFELLAINKVSDKKAWFVIPLISVVTSIVLGYGFWYLLSLMHWNPAIAVTFVYFLGFANLVISFVLVYRIKHLAKVKQTHMRHFLEILLTYASFPWVFLFVPSVIRGSSVLSTISGVERFMEGVAVTFFISVGMMVPLLLFGALVGWFYAYGLKRKETPMSMIGFRLGVLMFMFVVIAFTFMRPFSGAITQDDPAMTTLCEMQVNCGSGVHSWPCDLGNNVFESRETYQMLLKWEGYKGCNEETEGYYLHEDDDSGYIKLNSCGCGALIG